MKYIDYKNMKDFYTIAEVCRLFEMEMMELQRYSEKYKIYPQEDQYGNRGVPQADGAQAAQLHLQRAAQPVG